MPRTQTKPTQKQTPIAATDAGKTASERKAVAVKAKAAAEEETIKAFEAVTALHPKYKEAEAELEAATEAEAAEIKASTTYSLAKEIRGAHCAEESSYDITEHQFGILKAFLQIMKQNRGSGTPVDDFILDLHYHAERALSPDDIRSMLEECDGYFRDAIRDSKQLQAQYPKLFAPEPPPAFTESRDDRFERLGKLTGEILCKSSDERLNEIEALLQKEKASLDAQEEAA